MHHWLRVGERVPFTSNPGYRCVWSTSARFASAACSREHSNHNSLNNTDFSLMWNSEAGLLTTLFLACREVIVLSPCPHLGERQRACVSSSLIRAPVPLEQNSTLMTLFNLNHLLKALPESHGGGRASTYEFQGTQVSPKQCWTSLVEWLNLSNS